MSSLPASPEVPPNGLTTVDTVGLLVVSSNPNLRRDLLARLESDHWFLIE